MMTRTRRSSSLEERRGAFPFVRGAERLELTALSGCSGLSVENPNKKGGGAGDMIKGILQKAKEYVIHSLDVAG